jgi:hypothetical protein
MVHFDELFGVVRRTKGLRARNEDCRRPEIDSAERASRPRPTMATARRLGAIVTATDVRPATKERVESLGAKFLAVENEEFKNAQTAGGYAKEMSKEYQAKQAALTAEHIKRQDVVITTALIPGSGAEARFRRDGEVDAARLVLVELGVERGAAMSRALWPARSSIGQSTLVSRSSRWRCKTWTRL